MARRTAAIRAHTGSFGTAATAGSARLRPVPRILLRIGVFEDLPGIADATPGVHVGNFVLAEREGGREYTNEDGEVLVLLASQAARRIVEDLRMPGWSLEQLLEVLSWRCADGWEPPVSESPLAQELSSASIFHRRGHSTGF